VSGAESVLPRGTEEAVRAGPRGQVIVVRTRLIGTALTGSIQVSLAGFSGHVATEPPGKILPQIVTIF